MASPEHRQVALRPAQEGKAEVLRRRSKALAQPRLREVEPALASRLRQHASLDVATDPSLDARAKTLADRATRELGKRAAAEAADMAKILSPSATASKSASSS